MLVEKVSEPLDGILKDWDARIKSDTTLPAKLQEYPNPREETRGLAKHQSQTSIIDPRYSEND